MVDRNQAILVHPDDETRARARIQTRRWVRMYLFFSFFFFFFFSFLSPVVSPT
jgi:hypothetical protein